jgi:hypothetical protein
MMTQEDSPSECGHAGLEASTPLHGRACLLTNGGLWLKVTLMNVRYEDPKEKEP